MASFKLCDINISNLILCKCKKSRDIDIISQESDDIELITSKPKRYNNLIPKGGNYLYLKINLDEKIISVGDKNILKLFNLKKEDIYLKKISCVPKYKEFFSDNVLALFEKCIEDFESYQFEFSIKKHRLTCSLYPCSIPCRDGEMLSSVDLVIRKDKFSTDDKKMRMTSL